MNYPLSMISSLKPVAQILRSLNAGPRPKSCQTILYLKFEIKPFSLLSALVFMFFRSRIDASHGCVIGHAVYRSHVRRGPGIDRVLVGISAQIIEARDHLVFESFVHYILRPEIPHAVLHPLEVRHRHATCVRQNIGHNEDAFFVKYFIRAGRRRSISSLRQHLALQLVRVVRSDLVLRGRRYQHITRKLQQFLVIHKLDVLVSLKRPSGREILQRLRDIDSFWIVDTAVNVRYRYNLITRLVNQSRADTTNISRALHDNACLGGGHLEPLDRLVDNKQYAATGRLSPARRTTQVDWFTGYHCGDSVTRVHRIGVHDPGHGLLVGIHVGGGHVLLRSDEVQEFSRVAAGHALDFADRHLLRIANDAAFGAAEGHIHYCTFPRHPRCQRAHFVESDIRSVTYSALCWSTRKVVLHAITLKHLNTTRIHARRDIDLQLPVGNSQHGVQIRIEVQHLRRTVEARHHRFERVLFFYLANID